LNDTKHPFLPFAVFPGALAAAATLLLAPIAFAASLDTTPLGALAAGTQIATDPVKDLVITYVIPALGIAITGLLSVAVQRLWAWLGIKMDDSARAVLDAATSRGIAFAEHALDAKIASLPKSIDVRNAVAAEAINYVAPKVPDALARLGITPEQLADRVTATVTQKLGSAVSPPVHQALLPLEATIVAAPITSPLKS
jgi:hypothetical protein